ncbi:MAG: NAD(P)H-dependent oxidoreductase [Verrucomicrobiales bacterium]
MALRHQSSTKFDPARRIADADWSALEDALVLTPSSYGLQPWKFIAVTDAALKESLVPAAYGQRQVADCSHLLVIAAHRQMTADYVQDYVNFTAGVRGLDPENLAKFRDVMVRDIVDGPRGQQSEAWAKLQTYIALGNFMTCAALLGIDTCPMEGFVPAKVDAALGLPERGLTTAVLCPAGYRAADDKYAATPKVRFGKEAVVERIG